MSNRSPSEDLIRKWAASKLFRIISLTQLCIHTCAYIAAFIKLIMLEAGGYYDTGVWTFIKITGISIPLFALTLWLLRHSSSISKQKRFWGYGFHFIPCCWSIITIKISYFI
jgi:hypothetical protein